MKNYEAPQAERLELLADSALADIIHSEPIVEDNEDDLNVDDD